MHDTGHALHFGIMSSHNATAHVGGHTDPTVEVRLDIPFEGDTAYSIGTWQDWGTDTLRYGSLHVVVFTDDLGHDHLLAVRSWLRLASAGARLVDLIVVTKPGDWSVKTHLVDMSTHGQPYTYTVSRW